MQVNCDFCGSFMEDDEYPCPNCGATNENLKRVAPRTPQTIDELREGGKIYFNKKQVNK